MQLFFFLMRVGRYYRATSYNFYKLFHAFIVFTHSYICSYTRAGFEYYAPDLALVRWENDMSFYSVVWKKYILVIAFNLSSSHDQTICLAYLQSYLFRFCLFFIYFSWTGWMLIDLIGINGRSVCGVSLLTPNRLATAAHCWFDGTRQAWQF